MTLEVVSVIAPALIPLPFCRADTFNPLKTIWCRYSLDDALMFKGVLVLAAAHLEVLTQSSSIDPIALSYESDITSEVNRRLDSEALALTDSTITAVTLLAAKESIRGNVHELLIHRAALERMVSLRGGLQNLGLSGLLQMIVTWLDLTTGAMLKTSPRFPHITCTNSISYELMESMKASHRITTRNPATEIEFVSGSQPTFAAIFHNMQMLNILLRTARETKRANYSSVFYFCSMRFFLERCLLELEAEHEALYVRRTVGEMARLTCLIYLHRMLRELQPSVGVLVSLKSQVMALFREAERTVAWEDNGQYSETLLWVLCCAGSCWVDEEEKAFFAERMSVPVRQLGLRTWADVEGVLSSFLWIKATCRDKCLPLWREIELYGYAAPWMEFLGL
jgi:hypothetical protein